MSKFQRHVFICVNERDLGDPRGDCTTKGSPAVLDAFKKKLHDRGLKRIVRANKAGCLDQCAHGCTIVVYPEQVWYGHVKPSDVEEIIESHIVGGVPVKRLLIADDELTGKLP